MKQVTGIEALNILIGGGVVYGEYIGGIHIFYYENGEINCKPKYTQRKYLIPCNLSINKFLQQIFSLSDANSQADF